MTRANLRVWALEAQGWSELCTVGNWFGQNPENRGAFAPDPTADIAAAFALKEWFLDPCRVPRDDPAAALKYIDGGQKFMEEWNAADLWVCNAEAAALWICQTVYFAVTGEKAEIED